MERESRGEAERVAALGHGHFETSWYSEQGLSIICCLPHDRHLYTFKDTVKTHSCLTKKKSRFHLNQLFPFCALLTHPPRCLPIFSRLLVPLVCCSSSLLAVLLRVEPRACTCAVAELARLPCLPVCDCTQWFPQTPLASPPTSPGHLSLLPDLNGFFFSFLPFANICNHHS